MSEVARAPGREEHSAEGSPRGVSALSQLPRMMRVVRVIDENRLTKTFVFDRGVDANPGQFVMLWLPGLDEKPFGLLSDSPLAVSIAAVGPFSRAMHLLVPGDRVWVRGPFGQGFVLPSTGGSHLLVAGGYGAAPIKFLADRLIASGGRVQAALGAKSADELLAVEALEGAGADVTVTTEDGSAGERGLVTDAACRLLGLERPDAIYGCGPHGLLEALRQIAADWQVAAQLSWEAYMRCGIGLCGSCEHEGRLVCVDGPVYRYDPIDGPRHGR